jgi:hypothetical protein
MKKRSSSRPTRRVTSGVSFAPIVEVVCHETDTVSYSGIDAEMEQHAETIDDSRQSLGSYSSSDRRGSRRWSTEQPQSQQEQPLPTERETRASPHQTSQEQLPSLNSSWHGPRSTPSSPRVVAISPFVTVIGADTNAASVAAAATSAEDAGQAATEPDLHQKRESQERQQTKQEQLALLNSSWHSTGSVTSSRSTSTDKVVAMSPFVTVMGENNNNTIGNTDQDETDQASSALTTTSQRQTTKPAPRPSKREQLALLNSSWHSTGSATSSRSTPRVVVMSPVVTVMGNRASPDLEKIRPDDMDDDCGVDTGYLLDDQERGKVHSLTDQLDISPGRQIKRSQEDISASVTRTRASIPFAIPGNVDHHVLLMDDSSSIEDSDEW